MADESIPKILHQWSDAEGDLSPDLLVADNRTVLHEEVFGGVYAALDRIVPVEG